MLFVSLQQPSMSTARHDDDVDDQDDNDHVMIMSEELYKRLKKFFFSQCKSRSEPSLTVFITQIHDDIHKQYSAVRSWVIQISSTNTLVV